MSSTVATVNTLSDRLTGLGLLNEEVEILLGEDLANLTLNAANVTIPFLTGADSIDALTDVDTTTTAPANGDTLIWDGTNFVPQAAGAGFVAADTATIDLTLSGGTLTADFIGDSDDVAEGATNLYFTDARADARIAAADIGDLANVTETAPVNGQVLTFDGTNWVNLALPAAPVVTVSDSATVDMTLAGGDLSADVVVDPNTANILSASALGLLATLGSIDGHTDVDTSTTAPANGEYLTWDGTNWVPGAITLPGEYSGAFDASTGVFPTVDAIDGSAIVSQDWFNVTTAGTVDGQAFVPGDRLVAVTDGPGGTFAGNWAVISGVSAPVDSVNGQTGIVNLAASDLSDVDTTGAAVGQVLAWDGTNWGPAADNNYISAIADTATIDLTETGGTLTADFIGDSDDVPEGTANLYFTDARADARIAAADLGDLANVTETAPTNGQVLTWNGTNWVNQTPVAAPVTGVADTDTVDLTLAAGSLTADVIVDPAAGNILTASAAGLLATQAPLVLTTDGDATGVALSGVGNHTADITLLSGDASQMAVTGTDGGVLVEGAQVFEAPAITSTTATVMQSKLTDTLAAVAGGTYEVGVSYSWNYDAANSDFEAEFLWNGASLSAGTWHRQEPKDAGNPGNAGGATGSAQAHGFFKRHIVNLSAGDTPTFALNYRTDTAGVTSSLWDVIVTVRPI